MDDWQKKFYMNKDKFDPFDGQMTQRQHQQHQQQYQAQPITSPAFSCNLRPGTMLYRAIDTNGFGGTKPVTVPVGTVDNTMSQVEFTYDQLPMECILLENQASVLDLGKQNANTIKLYRVKSVFNGTFLVHESAINRGRTVMNNSPSSINVLKG